MNEFTIGIAVFTYHKGSNYCQVTVDNQSLMQIETRQVLRTAWLVNNYFNLGTKWKYECYFRDYERYFRDAPIRVILGLNSTKTILKNL